MAEPSADGVVEDTGIYPVMIDMVACLAAELEKRGLPELCFIGVLPGDTAIFDVGGCPNGKCGSAFVRLARTYVTDPFPQQDTRPGNCASRLAYDLEVGVIRCAQVVTSKGNVVGADEMTRLVRTQLADMAAIIAAIRCCMSKQGRRKDFVMGSYEPTAFAGGAGGGIVSVTIGQSTGL